MPPPHHPFYMHNKTPIVHRFINFGFPSEIWPIVIGFMNLKNILDFRLVSKLLQQLACQPFSEKAVIRFNSPTEVNIQQDKFLFATTAKTEIIIAVDLAYS